MEDNNKKRDGDIVASVQEIEGDFYSINFYLYKE